MAELVLLMEHFEESPVTATQIKMRRDPLLSWVSRYLHEGWPDQCDDQLRPYWCRKMELSLHDDQARSQDFLKGGYVDV